MGKKRARIIDAAIEIPNLGDMNLLVKEGWFRDAFQQTLGQPIHGEENVEILLKSGMEADSFLIEKSRTRTSRRTPFLHAAVRSGRMDIALLLLRNGADLTEIPYLLIVGARNGGNSASFLLEILAKKNEWRESEGKASEILESSNIWGDFLFGGGTLNSCKELIKAGVPIKTSQWSLLHSAANFGRVDVLEWMLKDAPSNLNEEVCEIFAGAAHSPYSEAIESLSFLMTFLKERGLSGEWLDEELKKNSDLRHNAVDELMMSMHAYPEVLGGKLAALKGMGVHVEDKEGALSHMMEVVTAEHLGALSKLALLEELLNLGANLEAVFLGVDGKKYMVEDFAEDADVEGFLRAKRESRHLDKDMGNVTSGTRDRLRKKI